MFNFLKSKSDDVGKLLLRVAVGGLMLFHGISKLQHGIEWLQGLLGSIGLPRFLGYGVYLGEVVAPVFILLGFRARIAALVVAFDMLMAIVLVLRAQVFAVKEMGGGWGIELEAFFLLASFALYFFGSGKYSVTKAGNDWD